jgi:type I restriction enzyme S subunit
VLDKSKYIQLASVCNIGNGFAFKSTEFKSEGIPLLRISNIDNERVSFDKKSVYVDKAYLTTHGKFIVKKGDVVIALSGATTGKYGIYELNEPALLNQRIGIIKQEESEALHSKYFYFYLNQLKAEILRKAQGAAQPNISTKELGQIELPVPPLKEQKKIAEILDASDSLRQKDQQLVEHYDRLSQSLFLDMFGEPVHNLKNWATKELNEVATSQLGKMLSQAAKKGINPKKYLRNANVRWGYFNLDDMLKMDFSDKEIKKFTLLVGDLLVCEGGDVGRCAIWKDNLSDCYFQKALHRVRVNSDIMISEYLQAYFYWMSKLGGLSSSTSEVTFSHLTAEKLKKLIVPLPPISLQKEYAIKLTNIEQQKELAQQSLQKSDDLFNSLLQKAFKGELTAS